MVLAYRFIEERVFSYTTCLNPVVCFDAFPLLVDGFVSFTLALMEGLVAGMVVTGSTWAEVLPTE
jgi:hypothetical protein